MSDEKRGEGDARESLDIGAKYDEVEPELGRLYEARHAVTGKPALLLLPAERVEWRPEGPWEVRLSYRAEPWTSRRRGAVAGLAVLTLILGWWSDPPDGTAHPRELPSSAALDGADETWSTEVEASSLQGGLPQPVRDQKRAPCTAGLEVEVSGVCWLSITQRPCPRPSVAHEGQCLLPVSAPRPKPTSVEGGPPGTR